MKREDFEMSLHNEASTIFRIRQKAHDLHSSVNQTYGDDLPYSYHLDMVFDIVSEFGHLVCVSPADVLPLIFGAYFHDSIEDARMTYNDVMNEARLLMTEEQALMATEIVYALTNDKGRTRAERAGEKYYAGIRQTPYAPFVKLCDRMANISFSCAKLDGENNRMRLVYKKEVPHFLDSIDPHSSDLRLSVPKEAVHKMAEYLVDDMECEEHASLPMVTILGPTATGKTALAAALARQTGGEIISADSRQVYRRMDIGTGKDLADYDGVAYHLIDICEPGTKYNLFQYQQDFLQAYRDIRGRGKLPILCGGTGLYIEAVLKGYQLSPVPQNPELRASLEGKSLEELTTMLTELKRQNGTTMHNTTDVDTPQRAIRAIEIEMDRSPLAPSPPAPAPRSIIIGVAIDRELRRERITQRLRARLQEGMIDEVRSLLDSGIAPEDLIYYGLEYKFVTLYVTGQLTYDEMFRQLEIAIHQFAKRQMTWFRGMERRGFTIHWMDATLPLQQKVDSIIKLLNS